MCKVKKMIRETQKILYFAYLSILALFIVKASANPRVRISPPQRGDGVGWGEQLPLCPRGGGRRPGAREESALTGVHTKPHINIPPKS